tara:strand:- start:1011 stop:1121 length:111 start_codon:yes stop_codon:yes gene_type:complete
MGTRPFKVMLDGEEKGAAKSEESAVELAGTIIDGLN